MHASAPLLPESTLCYGPNMPRVTPAHEQAVRARIVSAAVRVFAEKGYHGATMQDVVRESGLSIGAIYTWFKGKDELFLAACESTTGMGMGELATRVAAGRSTVERLAIAIGFFLDAVDEPNGGSGMASVLVVQWSRAEQEPAVREMLLRRRAQLEGAGRMLIAEGVARGELPAWIDVEGLTAAYILLLDGLLLWRVEQGDGYRRDEAIRRAMAVLAPIVAAASVASAPELPVVEGQPWSALDGVAATIRPERRSA
jgi:AcrR family transcriptional regulator